MTPREEPAAIARAIIDSGRHALETLWLRATSG